MLSRVGQKLEGEITPFLRNLGHDVCEEKNLTDGERREFRDWKHSELPRFQQTIRKLLAYNLDWIEQRPDYIGVCWDQHARKDAGCQSELTLARR
jgi:hypothetical protein